MGQRIEGTQRVGQVCFGSMRAARQDWQKRYFCAQEAFDEGKLEELMRPGTNLDLSAWLIGQGEPKFWVRHSLGFEADLPLTAGIGHRIGVKNGRSRGK